MDAGRRLDLCGHDVTRGTALRARWIQNVCRLPWGHVHNQHRRQRSDRRNEHGPLHPRKPVSFLRGRLTRSDIHGRQDRLGGCVIGGGCLDSAQEVTGIKLRERCPSRLDGFQSFDTSSAALQRNVDGMSFHWLEITEMKLL